MSQVKLVKDSINIVDVIGKKLDLKKAGTNYKALCPFHGESTPSFFVNEQLQRYRCFGCGASGDVFEFLQQYEGMSFVEALEELADQAGIKLEKFQKSPQDEERTQILEILNLAKEYFHYLLTEHKSGQVAKDYLKDRGTTQEITHLFQLGYSLDKWDGLINYLHKKKGYSLDLLEKTGLAINKDGRYYDRFRGRLMFPLRNHRGQVVGFSGRVLDPEVKQAKYINSPETSVYHKSEVLFGFSENYQQIKQAEQVIVTEGEFDCLSSLQAHVSQTVAIKGSALTEQQVKLLARTVKKVILALDRDEAGMKATRRAVEVVAEANTNLELRVVNLDVFSEEEIAKLKDPDDMARFSPEKWRQAVKSSISVYEFLIQAALQKYDLKTPEGKRDFITELAEPIWGIDHQVEKDFYLKKLAELLNVKKQLVEEDIKGTLKRAQSGTPIRNSSRDNNQTTKPTAPQKISRLQKIERYILFLTLQLDNAETLKKIKRLNKVEWQDSKIKLFMEAALKREPFSLKKTLQDLGEDVQEYISNLYLSPTYTQHTENLKIKEEWDKTWEVLKKEINKQKVKSITDELTKLESKQELSEEEEALQMTLLQQIVALKKGS
jgi:DNA primase